MQLNWIVTAEFAATAYRSGLNAPCFRGFNVTFLTKVDSKRISLRRLRSQGQKRLCSELDRAIHDRNLYAARDSPSVGFAVAARAIAPANSPSLWEKADR